MAERLIRGHVINRYLDFIKKTWGADGLEQAKKESDLAEIKIDDSKFYDNEIMLRILKWISKNHGIERVRQAGKFTVKNLGLFSYLVRFLSMETMLHKAEERYRELYKFGNIDIELFDNRAVATLTDSTMTKENCMGWMGVLEAMLEMTKTKGTVSHPECHVGDDGNRCVFVVEWQ